MKKLLIAAFLWSSVFQVQYSTAQSFSNINESLDIFVNSSACPFGSGLSFADFNGDGWDDLTFGSCSDSIHFYQNNSGTFERVLLNVPPQYSCKGLYWVDIDNDGDSDFMTTNYGGGCRIYENLGDMQMADITQTTGLFMDNEFEIFSYSAAWGDYDKDGFLDVFIANFSDPVSETQFVRNYLYRNNGDNTFTETTFESGLTTINEETFQGVWQDYNRDGHLDLFTINDKLITPNKMFKNNGDGTFTEVSDEINVGQVLNSMSNSHADIDIDGDLDLYITNTQAGNLLLKAEDEYYTDVTTEYNAYVFSGCWSSNFFDYNNDMYDDLFVSTSSESLNPFNPLNVFYRNEGGQIFLEDAEVFPNNTKIQYTSACGDINNDGKIDVVGHNHGINDGPDIWLNVDNYFHRYIKVTLEGVVSNRDGVGAFIDLYVGDHVLSKFTFCGEDFICQDSRTEHFGLDSNTGVDTLIITWPSGHIDTFYDEAVNQSLNILEGSSLVIDIEGQNICNGNTVTLTASEGYSSYLWNNEMNTQSIEVTEAGEYTVIGYTDLGVPSPMQTFVVEELAGPETVVSATNLSCYGDASGSISIAGMNEDDVITEVIWSNDSLGNSLSNIEAGVYEFTAFGTNSCASSGSIEISQPDSMYLDYVTSDVSCFDSCDGLIELSISGGTGAYTLSGQEDELCAGIYNYQVIDSLGCSKSFDFEIDSPEELFVELNTSDVTEDEYGTAQIVITGGTPPYSTNWSNGEVVNEIDDLEIDDYSVNVIDYLGCEFSIDFSIALNQNELDQALIELYPNPVVDVIHFSSSLLNDSEYIIYDLSGKTVQKGKIEDDKIQLQNFSNGTYVLELEFNKNQTSRTRFIVQ